MSKNVFKLVSVIVMIVMAVMQLTACAPAATPTTAAPAQPTTAPTQAEPTKAPEATKPAEPTATTAVEPTATTAPAPLGEVKGIKPKGDGKLVLWIAGNGPDLQQAFGTVVDNFQKDNPGFQVSVEYIPWGDLSTKLTTAFAGNVGPDVFMHGVAASAGFMSKDQILDLTTYFNALPDKDDFYPALMQGATVNGKVAMMPTQVTNYMLIYRKDLYQEAGLDPAKPPKTWDELIQNAQKLTKTDSKGITTAGLQLPFDDNADVEMTFAPILRTYGGDLLSADGKKATFNSDAGKAALQLYVDMFQKYKVASLVPLPGDPNTNAMGRGAVAQSITGQFDLADLKANNPEVYKQIAVALPPAGPSGKPSTMSTSSGFMINKNSKNPDDAWTLLRYLVSPQSLITIDSGSLFLAPRKSMATADYVVSDPLFKIFADNLSYGAGNPNVPAWVQVRNALGEQLIAALNGKASVADALGTAESKVNDLLSK